MSIRPSLDTGYPALILTASRRTIHHGALDLARSLGRLGIPVYATVQDRCAPLAMSRYVTKSFVWKTWPNDRQTFLAAMSKLGEIINRRTILFPIDDLAAVVVGESSPDLHRWYVTPPLSWSPRQLANKAKFYSLCAKIGIPIARSVVPQSLEEVRQFSKNTTFPVVVKAAEQWRLIQNRFNVKIIHNPESLLEFCQSVSFSESQQLVLQEFIPGDDWIYHGYCNSPANLYLSFTGKKLLDYPPGAGATALGLSFNNGALSSQSERFLRAISYSGIVDIDWRQDERDGQFKIMDCNPRVGMNFRMFENTAGIDVVRAQHLNLTGRSVTAAPMVHGKLFIVESYYLLSLIRGGASAQVTDGTRRPQTKEYAWWSTEDVLPFVVMTVRLTAQTIARAVRYIWQFAAGRHRR